MRVLSLFVAVTLCNAGIPVPYPPASEMTQLLNHAQLVMQLAREAQMLTTQIRMFSRMTLEGKLLTSFQMGTLSTDLVKLSQNIRQGQGLSYNMGRLDLAFKMAYPGYMQSGVAFDPQYRRWNQVSLDTLTGILANVGAHANQFSSDAMILNFVQEHARDAIGQDQIAQAGTEIAAFQSQQLMKLRELMMEQTTAIVTTSGRQINADQAHQQVIQEAIGPGKFSARN